MRVELVVEDTEQGIVYGVKTAFNDVNDGYGRSLACHLVANFEGHMASLIRMHALRMFARGDERGVECERKDLPPTRR